MAKDNKEGWTVRAVGVSFVDGVRLERPLEDFTTAELNEIAARKNVEALAAAGYVPVSREQQRQCRRGSSDIDRGRSRTA